MPLPMMMSVGAGEAGGAPLPADFCDISSVQSVGDVPTLTMSHTHAAPCDQILLWLNHYDQFINVTSVTFNGVEFTQLAQIHNTRTYLLQNPPIGTFDIVATMWQPRRSTMAAYSLHGFDFSDVTMHQASGANTVPTIAVAGAVGEYIFDYVNAEPLNGLPVTWTVGAGQTELFTEDTPSATNQISAGSYESSAVSVTASWTISTSSFWGITVLAGVKGIPQPPGGGEVPPCEGPDPGLVPLNPLTYIHIRTVAGVHYYFGVPQLNDDDDWQGGKKPGKLLEVSDIKHTLGAQGAFEGSRVTARIVDIDRQFRTLVATVPLRGSCFEVFWVDDDVRRAKGEPFRLFSGTLTDHKGVTGFIYELTAHDTLAAKLAVINQQPTIPPDRLTAAVFPGLDPAIEGHAAPIVVGMNSDDVPYRHTGLGPQGVVPPKFLGGPLNFQAAFGGINHDVDVYLLSKGALPANGVWQGYYNDPADPSVRLEIPSSAWGSVVWAPGKPGWSDVGVATDYVDYNGERYTPFFVSRSLGDLADAVKDGRVLVAFNLFGAESEGDGRGSTIESPARIWQWLITNYGLLRYRTGLYFNVPNASCIICAIDTDSVETAHQAHISRLLGGYIAGFVLGRGGQVQSVFDVLGELCQGADMDQGINRHGQLMLSVEDHSILPAMTFDAYDIEDGTYETWVDTSQLVNRVEQEYGFLYVPPVAPAPTPVPSKPLKDEQQWASGLTVTESLTAQAATNEIVTLKLENYVIRDPATANNVAQHILNRGIGATGEGPRMFRFRGGPWLLGVNGSPATILDLGSVFFSSHPEKIGATTTVLDKCRILTITYHPLKKRVTYEGRVIGGVDWVAME
jgi:hypothetical protein